MGEIEAAWAEFVGHHGEHDRCPVCIAARALALAELNDYMAEVDREAEADVIAGNPLEGAHYRAMRTVAAKHRLRIEALGR